MPCSTILPHRGQRMLTFGLQDCNMSCLCNIFVLLHCNSWLLNKLSTEAPAGRPKLGPRRALQCICMATGAEQVLQPQSRLMYPSKVSHDLVQARKVHNSHVTKGNSSWSWYLAPIPAHTTPPQRHLSISQILRHLWFTTNAQLPTQSSFTAHNRA